MIGIRRPERRTMTAKDQIKWENINTLDAPSGYLYKYLQYDKNSFLENIDNIILLKNKDSLKDKIPVIKDGKYKGFLGMSGFLFCKVKI